MKKALVCALVLGLAACSNTLSNRQGADLATAVGNTLGRQPPKACPKGQVFVNNSYCERIKDL